MRVYLSGPMSGIPRAKYARHFAEMQAHLEHNGCSVINPVMTDAAMPDDLTYEDRMKIDLCLIELCDAICLLDGWEKSCGANREYGYAIARGLQIMFESGVKICKS